MSIFHYFSPSSSGASSAVKVGDVEVGEVDDLDQDLAGLQLGPSLPAAKLLKSHHNFKPIDVNTAVVSLKNIIFKIVLLC